MNIIFFLLLSFLSNHQVVGQELKFKPHMIDHLFEGCPENSHCEKKWGKMLKRWTQKVKQGNIKQLNEFRLRYGMPLKLWTHIKPGLNSPIIQWDAPCSRLKNQGISEAIIFAPSFKQLSKKNITQHQLNLHRAFSFDKNLNALNSYIIPRGESPLFVEQKKLYFTIEESGKYFGLAISSQGDMELNRPQSVRPLPETINCPAKIQDFIKSQGLLSDTIYSGYHCLQVYNKSTKSLNYLMIGHSCP